MFNLLCHSISRFCRPTSAEHGQLGEKPLRLGREKLVAPVQGRAQSLVPLQGTSTAANQKVETMLQLREHLRWRQPLRSHRRQLECQRDTFQSVAQCGDGSRIVFRELEVGPHRLCPVYEE